MEAAVILCPHENSISKILSDFDIVFRRDRAETAGRLSRYAPSPSRCFVFLCGMERYKLYYSRRLYYGNI